jgi:predicted MFS family arabinose efflux permease
MALIDNETQDEIIDLVVFGFTLAIIVGVLGFVIGRFTGRR